MPRGVGAAAGPLAMEPKKGPSFGGALGPDTGSRSGAFKISEALLHNGGAEAWPPGLLTGGPQFSFRDN